MLPPAWSSMVPPGANDEDGVEFLTPIMPGRTAQIRVTAGTTGYLNSWFDFNGDGTLDSYTITAIAGPGGYTPPGLPITSAADILLSEVGAYTLTFNVPGTVTDKLTTSLYSRHRFAPTAGEGNTPSGLAVGGEVEDYVLAEPGRSGVAG
jgi:hypothetical protein